MADIGIVGFGIVGKATAHSFTGPGNTIRWYDKFKAQDGAHVGSSFEEVAEASEYIFVCLPTESDFEKLSVDLSIMDDNMAKLTQHTAGTSKIVVIKSTVVPGTTNRYERLYPSTNFAFNPEFLTEANYLKDAENPDRIIVGASRDIVSLRLTDLYRNTFPSTPLFRTDATSAEMVKYMANCYLAVKVTFANQMYELSEKLGIKYEEVKRMVAADHRIEDTHLDVTTLRGFGGKCFPKDMIALIGLCRELNVEASLLEAAWDYNCRIRRRGPDGSYDWEHIAGVVSQRAKQPS